MEIDRYGADRVFVATSLGGEKVAPEPSALERAGHPLMAWNLADEYELGGEFFKWEFATAVAGAVLAVNPFDEPNVAEAKAATRSFISGEDQLDTAAAVEIGDLILQVGGMDLPVTGDPEEIPGKFIEQLQPGEYLGFLIYIPPEQRTARLLEGLRRDLGEQLQAATTLGYGPRYLHSTGQLHKGGAANGRFIQITGESGGFDLAIPGRDYSFGQLYQAQTDGDYAVLQAKPRPVLRVTLKGDRFHALEAFRKLAGGQIG
ncbi:MAG: transaldolase, partial [Pseudomonadota bacterium]|nr:transaldolase [Pseudomonadota bacterium]